MNKVIIYCADGTWNAAGHSALLEKDKPELSNVYRLFEELRGDSISQVDGGVGLWAEEKAYTDLGGDLAQVAMYGHGVGENAHNLEEHVVGGAFGGGLTTRIRLGYAFISRRFEPGDRIAIIGFSRGAYAARALADMIATQGLLRADLATEHHPLSWAAGAWLKYREVRSEGNVASTVEASEDLHRTALKAIGRIPTDSHLRPTKVAAVGVFDTVGSMGFPDLKGGTRLDHYGFIRNDLLPHIMQAFHAVSVDEQRVNFIPSLWKPDSRLKQVLFPGAHSDIGGGYPNHELADEAFEWMFDQLAATAIFKAQHPTAPDFSPNPLGLAHRPWSKLLSGIERKLRKFPDDELEASFGLLKRMDAPAVPVEGAEDFKYAPLNLPRLAK